MAASASQAVYVVAARRADFTGTATGAPDGNAAEAKAATQVLAVATMCIVQMCGLYSWTFRATSIAYFGLVA